MFSLIITIISIALVAALALATIYYGGSAFRQGADAAHVGQVICGTAVASSLRARKGKAKYASPWAYQLGA